MRGLMRKPSVASPIAGWNSSFHASLPLSEWASSSIRSTPGVPIERPLARALGTGSVRLASDTQRR